jgi:hypothetical protein
LLAVQFSQSGFCAALAGRFLPDFGPESDGPVRVVILGVIGPTLAVDLSLETTDFPLAGLQFGAERF